MHGDWEQQLEELYDLGVRSVEIAHETDTDFSGAALHHGFLFKVMQWLKADKHPQYVLLPKAEYAKRKKAWGLP